MKTYNPATVPVPTAPYSHGAEIPAGSRLLYISGEVGVARDGSVPPDIKGQAELVWKHILAVLAEAGMGVENLVKLNHYLTKAENIPAYGEVRTRFLGAARPASTMVVVTRLVDPSWLVEVEAVAAKA